MANTDTNEHGGLQGAAPTAGGGRADAIIDLEEYAKSGRTPPAGREYRIRVDKVQFTVSVSSMTGRQILDLAGKVPPERYRLDAKFKGGRTQQIGLADVVDFTTPGLERFMTLPLDQTEG